MAYKSMFMSLCCLMRFIVNLAKIAKTAIEKTKITTVQSVMLSITRFPINSSQRHPKYLSPVRLMYASSRAI